MLIIQPYLFVADRSPVLRRFIFGLTSETWSFLGLGFTILAAVAGYLHWPAAYAGMLCCELLCDTHDGYAYQENEKGIANGYGLYLDHVVDAVAAALITYGGYALVGHGLACVVGLALYYLIAIHSWLYKITQMTRGRLDGLYYAITVSKPRRLLLNVDDLTIAIGVIAISGWVPLIYVIDGVLLVIFIGKVARAVVELRSDLWRPAVQSSPPAQTQG